VWSGGFSDLELDLELDLVFEGVGLERESHSGSLAASAASSVPFSFSSPRLSCRIEGAWMAL